MQIRFRCAAADAAAQLMQLRQTVAVRVEHDHHARVGDVHADFDDRRRDQHVELAAHEPPHRPLLLARREASVQQADAQVGKDFVLQPLGFGDGAGELVFAFVDRRRDDVRLIAAGDVLAHELVDASEAAGSHGKRFDRRSPGWKLVEMREVEVGVDRLRERPRNRRRRHVQRVRRSAFGSQPRALLDAEPMLFVDDRQPEPFEIDALRQQRVGSDRKRGLAAGQLLDRRASRARALAAENRFDADPAAAAATAPISGVLRRQNLGRRHQRRLHPVGGRQQHRGGGNQRLSAADVALQQPVHRNVARHVVPNLARSRRCAPVKANGSDASRRSSKSEGTLQRASVVVALALCATQLRGRRQRQKLRENEPFARALGLLRILRCVNGAVRFAQRE